MQDDIGFKKLHQGYVVFEERIGYLNEEFVEKDSEDWIIKLEWIWNKIECINDEKGYQNRISKWISLIMHHWNTA